MVQWLFQFVFEYCLSLQLFEVSIVGIVKTVIFDTVNFDFHVVGLFVGFEDCHAYKGTISMAVRTYLYGDDRIGPRISICMSSPGKDFIVETCSGGLSREGSACVIWRLVEEFLI